MNKEYLDNVYGRCIIDPCACLKTGCWMGVGCVNWRPDNFTGLEDMVARAREIKDRNDARASDTGKPVRK